MKLPILWNHDPQEVIGALEDGIVTFKPYTVTPDMIHGRGFRVLDCQEKDGEIYVSRAEILEVSCYPPFCKA